MTRRDLLAASAAPLLLNAQTKPRVAAIVTEYRHWSHADVVVGRLLAGCSPNGRHRPNRCQVVSLYAAQSPAGTDMVPDLAPRFGFTVYPTIADALTLGGKSLAVDAVVFIGEHGQYPTNDLGQKLYPRYELFSQILDVYERSGRGVPTFFDKHLSYSWEKADTLFQRVRKLGFPFLSGSSIPVTVRFPEIDLPLGTPLTGAVAIAYGDPDAYGFHTLEALQSIVERRRGGETGIRRVDFKQGAAAWEWMRSHHRPLWDAAWQRMPGATGSLFDAAARDEKPALFVLEYRDGLTAGALITRLCQHWTAAVAPASGAILATRFGGPEIKRPLPHFDGLVDCIEEMFITRKEPYPPERTLLTTGALAHGFAAKRQGAAVETPGLAISYQAPQNVYRQRS